MEIQNKQENPNKTPLENLSKEDLIKKCKALLVLAQKAKQTKDCLSAECSELKEKLNNVTGKHEEESKATTLMIENLTQQKLNLFMTVEELKKQQQESDKKFIACQTELKDTVSKLNNLDNENQSHVRQIKRLTEENEELITHLDRLENDIQQMKQTNVSESASENCLEEKNSKIIELQTMLTRSLEEVKKFQIHTVTLNEEIKSHKIVSAEKDKVIGDLNCAMQQLQEDLQQKNESIEKSMNEMDDLNTELHKNRAVIEKLNRDVGNTKNKLNENQITGSQVTGDLENANEKLRSKLKSYRMKIIKIAGDIKVLKQTKEELLKTIGESAEQVQKWKEQLMAFNNLFVREISDSAKERQRLLDELNEAKQLLETIKSEKENANIQLQEKEVKLVAYEKQNATVENYATQISRLQSEKEKLSMQVQQLQERNDELTEKFGTSNNKNEEELASLQEKLLSLETKLETSKQEREKLLAELTETREENRKLSEEIGAEKSRQEKEETSKQDNEKLMDELKNLSVDLKNQLQIKQDELLATQNKMETLLQETAKLQGERTEYESEKQSYLSKLKSLEVQLEDKSNETEMEKLKEELTDLSAQLKTAKRENGELLAEMNEMNEVLKERGETISKQHQYCEEILKTVGTYEKQLSEASKHAEALTERDNKVKELEKEVEHLKAGHTHGDSANIDHQVEAPTEKVKELEAEIINLKEKLSQMESQSFNYAESENMSTSTISRTEEASRLKDLEGSWEERYGKLRNLALKLRGKVREQTALITQEQSEKSELHTKLVSATKNVQLLQTQCDELQDNLESSKREASNLLKRLESSAQDVSKDKNKLATNDEIISELRLELENAKMDKKTVENSNKNLLSQIQSLKKEIESVLITKREFESKISKLETDILSRDKTINEEMEKRKVAKAQMQELSKECKSKSVLDLEMQDYERSLKDLTQKLEKRQELVTDLQSTVDSQQHTIMVLREEVRLLEDRILNEESELTTARTEISTVKKQLSDTESLISQKENRIHEIMHSLEISRGENEDANAQLAKIIADNQKIYESVKNEKEQYKIQVLSLEQAITELKDNLSVKNDELENVRKEYEGYKIRAQSVLRQNQTRDVGLEERLNEEVTSLKGEVKNLAEELVDLKGKFEVATSTNATVTSERDSAVVKLEETSVLLDMQTKNCKELEGRYQQAVSEHAETVRSLKVHADTLGQCYRQQLSEQEALHNDELKELRSLLEKNVIPQEEQMYVPPPMPREECEGSESLESSILLMNPLEKLLSGGDTDAELKSTKEQLMQHDARLKHLTGLLADAEQDLAKHVQMNQLLKEEIRRQQRSVEREQHAENLEYLKNVVVKFITLNNGDERNRLIPVLNTILKLSPEETQKLNAVVNGDPSAKGWGSYLPMWNSPKPS